MWLPRLEAQLCGEGITGPGQRKPKPTGKENPLYIYIITYKFIYIYIYIIHMYVCASLMKYQNSTSLVKGYTCFKKNQCYSRNALSLRLGPFLKGFIKNHIPEPCNSQLP